MIETQNGFKKYFQARIQNFPLIFHWKTKGIQFGNTLFIHYKNAFDSVQIQILLDILKPKNIPNTLLKAIVDFHKKKERKKKNH